MNHPKKRGFRSFDEMRRADQSFSASTNSFRRENLWLIAVCAIALGLVAFWIIRLFLN